MKMETSFSTAETEMNTGGANAPPLRPMEIPEGLQRILDSQQ
ncbi:MAG: DUF3703 domain-containing protein [Haliscomenobacteraceae bacterium CHB4]|nr:DUF3703 domain-containing protein [Haliscomenobacteraceae bacterium CHB4]